jgi:hypothetical protein
MHLVGRERAWEKAAEDAFGGYHNQPKNQKINA